MLLVTAVTVLPSAGTTAMVDSEHIADVNTNDAPQELESRDTKTTTTGYYGLLVYLIVFVPLLAIAAVPAAYSIYR